MSDEKNINPDEEPQLFSVKKGNDGGWQFSRRDFIKGAGAVGVVATLGGVSHAQDAEETPIPIPTIPKGLRAHADVINALAISPDGKLLVSGGNDNKIKLWSLPDGGLIKTIESPVSDETFSPAIRSLLISPDGTRLFSGGNDNDIRIWSLPDGELLNTLTLHTRVVTGLAITPDGTLLISGSASGNEQERFIVWSLPNGTAIKNLAKETNSRGAVAISPDGTMLVTSEPWGINFWSLPDFELINTREGGSEHIIISPDGERMVSCDNVYHRLNIRTFPRGSIIKMLDGHTDTINAIVITPDSKRIISAGDDHTIHFWSLDNRELLFSIQATLKMGQYDSGVYGVKALAITPDGTLLVSGAGDSTIKLWSLPDGIYVKDLIDIAVALPEFEGAQYSPNDEGSSVITLPCGSDIPTGSTCICNCVAGGGCSCVGYSGSNGTHYWYPN
jgi:WD40 repeat protein